MDSSTNDMAQLPSTATLLRMAKDDPAGLELLRLKLVNSIIEQAPISSRAKLRQLQANIDQTRKKSENSMQACISISLLMVESLATLQDAMQKLSTATSELYDGSFTDEGSSTVLANHDSCPLQFDKKLLSDEPELEWGQQSNKIRRLDFSTNSRNIKSCANANKYRSAQIIPFRKSTPLPQSK